MADDSLPVPAVRGSPKGKLVIDWKAPVVHPLTGARTPRYLHGVIVPMFTPCNSDHTLDETAIRAYTDVLIESGAISGLFLRGGLGKMFEFEFDEVKRLIDVVADQAAGRVPVMAGCAGIYNGTLDRATYIRQSIELCRHAQDRDAIAVVLLVPSELVKSRGDDDTAFEYFRDVASETDMPILIYQPPPYRRTYRIGPRLLERLMAIPNIVGLKYSTDRMNPLTLIAEVVEGSDFALIAGDERAFSALFMLGGTGVIGQGASNNPEILKAVYERLMASDYAGASRAAMDASRAVSITDGLNAVAAGLNYLAYKGKPIQPFTKAGIEPVSSERLERFVRQMDELRSRYTQNQWWERTGQ